MSEIQGEDIGPADDQDAIDPAALEQAMAALATAGLDPEQMQKLMARMVTTKEDIKASLADEVRAEVAAEFELEADAGHKLDFKTRAHGGEITIGIPSEERTIKLRYLVNADFERLSSLIPDVVRFLYKRGPSALEEMTPTQLITDILTYVRSTDGQNEFKAAFYRELALCLSTDSEEVTPEFLREACLPSDLHEACQSLYEANTRFFTGLWRVLPGDIATAIHTNFGKITSHLKNLAQLILAFAADSNGIGGILNGGSTSSLIRSALSMAGRLPKSAPSPSSTPGA